MVVHLQCVWACVPGFTVSSLCACNQLRASKLHDQSQRHGLDTVTGLWLIPPRYCNMRCGLSRGRVCPSDKHLFRGDRDVP